MCLDSKHKAGPHLRWGTDYNCSSASILGAPEFCDRKFVLLGIIETYNIEIILRQNEINANLKYFETRLQKLFRILGYVLFFEEK